MKTILKYLISLITLGLLSINFTYANTALNEFPKTKLDSGSYFFYVNKIKVGYSKFSISKLETLVESFISINGVENKSYLSIENSNNKWDHAHYVNNGRVIQLENLENSVQIVSNSDTTLLKTIGNELPIEDMSPILYHNLLNNYYDNPLKNNSFNLVMIPGLKITGNLIYKGERKINIKEETLIGEYFSLQLPPIYTLNLTVLDKKIIRIGYPAQNADFILSGFEDLLNIASVTNKPNDLHNISITNNFKLKTSSDIFLSCDIYEPKEPGKYPTVLMRTPYNKAHGESIGTYFAQRGIVFVSQDVRGRNQSTGIWNPFENEKEDGSETLNWILEQPWSNGQIGLYGQSYCALAAWHLASKQHEKINSIVSIASPSDPFSNMPYENGFFSLISNLSWVEILERQPDNSLSNTLDSPTSTFQYQDLLKTPIIDLDEKILKKNIKYWDHWIQNKENNTYWENKHFLEHLTNSNLPVLHISGWFDNNLKGTINNYNYLKSNGNQNQQLIVGPWNHLNIGERYDQNGRDLGEMAQVDIVNKSYSFFNQCFDAELISELKKSEVLQFVLHEKTWIRSEDPLLPKCRVKKFFLGESSSKFSMNSPGVLQANNAKSAKVDFTQFKSNSNNPNPGSLYNRNDQAVFVTEPFIEDCYISGPIEIKLFANSNQFESDWIVRFFIMDSSNNIKFLSLFPGAIRSNSIDSNKSSLLSKEDQILEYNLATTQITASIKKYEKILVVISSSLFPRYDLNLQKNRDRKNLKLGNITKQRIYFGGKYSSHIRVPIINDISEYYIK